MTKSKSIMVDGVEYVPKLENKMAKKLDGLEYVMCRTYSAGVFAGYLKERNGKEVELLNARRIWSWAGAASLSQLAMEGTSKPKDCKFPIAVEKVILTEAIEIIPITEKAQKSIEGVPEWTEQLKALAMALEKVMALALAMGLAMGLAIAMAMANQD